MPVLEHQSRVAIDDALAEIRTAFVEMPGLQLTVAQASRLWQIDPLVSRLALDVLVDTAFLRRREARYERPDVDHYDPTRCL